MTKLLAVIIFLFSTQLYAGSSGPEFNGIYDTLIAWSQGYLGKLIAICMVILGISEGIRKQSLMSFTLDISAGIGIYTIPTVLESVISSTLPAINNG